jgi:hypothetical protein
MKFRESNTSQFQPALAICSDPLDQDGQRFDSKKTSESVFTIEQNRRVGRF